MRIAVTGGSGFIGSALVDALVQHGDEVTNIDLVEPPEGRRDSTFVKCDLLEFGKTLDAIRGYEVVYHFAGVVLEYVRKDPFRGSALNVEITRNVVEACKRTGKTKLIFASSFYVYDHISPKMIVNEETPLNTLDMELFGATKIFGENLIREYNRLYRLEYVILRFGSAYGLGNCTNVVKTFLEDGRAGRTIEIWGSGRRRNQYTFVGDLAQGAMNAVKSTNEVYNLISPEDTTVGELAEHFRAKYGFDVRYLPSKPEGASMPYMSSRKAIREIGWSPVALKEGVERMVAQYEGRRVPSPISHG